MIESSADGDLYGERKDIEGANHLILALQGGDTAEIGIVLKSIIDHEDSREVAWYVSKFMAYDTHVVIMDWEPPGWTLHRQGDTLILFMDDYFPPDWIRIYPMMRNLFIALRRCGVEATTLLANASIANAYLGDEAVNFEGDIITTVYGEGEVVPPIVAGLHALPWISQKSGLQSNLTAINVPGGSTDRKSIERLQMALQEQFSLCSDSDTVDTILSGHAEIMEAIASSNGYEMETPTPQSSVYDGSMYG